ncbi:MAG: TerB family tellurite resistance protein [Bacteroidetes bacterium]|nr:MAG: TerB family tellurite resistance protein [Bacteroidota bacterium]
MKTNTSDWTYNQFLAYLLLYAAHADTKLTDEEKEVIFSRTGTHNYHAVKTHFGHANDYERLQVILGFRDSYFPDEHSRKKLLKNLHELFLSDYEFSAAEQGFLLGIKRVLAG